MLKIIQEKMQTLSIWASIMTELMDILHKSLKKKLSLKNFNRIWYINKHQQLLQISIECMVMVLKEVWQLGSTLKEAMVIKKVPRLPTLSTLVPMIKKIVSKAWIIKVQLTIYTIKEILNIINFTIKAKVLINRELRTTKIYLNTKRK